MLHLGGDVIDCAASVQYEDAMPWLAAPVKASQDILCHDIQGLKGGILGAHRERNHKFLEFLLKRFGLSICERIA